MSSKLGHFDVCVLGSGFAGSLSAMILSKSGLSVAILDRSTHPRFSIGESSTPAADYLLHQLAVQYEIPELLPLCRFGSWRETYPDVRCGCKRGFSYVWHGAGEDYRAARNHDCELMVAASASRQVADTQWYRPDVDQLLFHLALKYRVVAFESTNVDQVYCDWVDQRKRWRLVATTSGKPCELTADFVIDASGPASALAKSQQLVDCTSTLQTNTAAWFTHLENCGSTNDWLKRQGANTDDFPYPIDQAAVHHLFRDGWMWQIGFEGNLTSVGFVQVNHSNENYKTGCGEFAGPDEASLQWAEILASRPVLQAMFNDASIAPVPGRILSTPRVQRLSSAACGESWAALPFTVGFIDPLHSTGIAHSLSGLSRICQALIYSSDMDRKTRLQQYAAELFDEFQHVDQLIAGCYEALVDFRLFNCWTMLYFAAATTFERRHRQGEQTSFLLSGDSEFRKIIQQARRSLDKMTRCNQGSIDDRLIEGYQREVRDLIAPYNHVGLFAPRINNMYWHTAAEKYD